MLQGTAGRAAELKSQGALEASRDPNSSVDAKAAEETIKNQAKAAGAPTFEFDPDATPEQKKEQLKAVGAHFGFALDITGANEVRSKHQSRDRTGSTKLRLSSPTKTMARLQATISLLRAKQARSLSPAHQPVQRTVASRKMRTTYIPRQDGHLGLVILAMTMKALCLITRTFLRAS